MEGDGLSPSERRKILAKARYGMTNKQSPIFELFDQFISGLAFGGGVILAGGVFLYLTHRAELQLRRPRGL